MSIDALILCIIVAAVYYWLVKAIFSLFKKNNVNFLLKGYFYTLPIMLIFLGFYKMIPLLMMVFSIAIIIISLAWATIFIKTKFYTSKKNILIFFFLPPFIIFLILHFLIKIKEIYFIQLFVSYFVPMTLFCYLYLRFLKKTG